MSLSSYIEPAGAEPFIDRIAPYQMRVANSQKCEAGLQFGVFFDGTDNNYERDQVRLADTNIARLWRCYPNQLAKGIESLYVPGVGTAFTAIGSPPEGWRGTAFGVGCEARVLFALLKTLDFVYRFSLQRASRFNKQQLRVLCKESKPSSEFDLYAILQLGYERGLPECDDRGEARKTFFESEFKRLRRVLSESEIKVTELVIDIFGFSRGAAEARTYASWLNEMLVGGRFAGVPLTIRFMGLFDTVASAGIMEMLETGLMNRTGGHAGWARKESLLIPKQVLNCVHFVAMHELRKNFPIDETSINGAYSSNIVEVAYPGSHSDVGGGYAPGDLGIAVGGSAMIEDSTKLSQVALNHLFEYAIASFVPLSKDRARGVGTYDPFAVSPELKRDFEAFVAATGAAHRRLSDWMEVYLAWRWVIRNNYPEARHVRMATTDRELLLRANRKLIADAELLLAPHSNPVPKRAVKDLLYDPKKRRIEFLTNTRGKLDVEATAVLQRAMSLGEPAAVFVNFFDKYIHDSYAGFCKSMMEPSGYWRYRKGFQGADEALNAEIDEIGADGNNVS